VKGRPCSKCKKKPRLSYHSLCRDCKRNSVNQWRRANPERYRGYQQEYYHDRKRGLQTYSEMPNNGPSGLADGR